MLEPVEEITVTLGEVTLTLDVKEKRDMRWAIMRVYNTLKEEICDLTNEKELAYRRLREGQVNDVYRGLKGEEDFTVTPLEDWVMATLTEKLATKNPLLATRLQPSRLSFTYPNTVLIEGGHDG